MQHRYANECYKLLRYCVPREERKDARTAIYAFKNNHQRKHCLEEGSEVSMDVNRTALLRQKSPEFSFQENFLGVRHRIRVSSVLRSYVDNSVYAPNHCVVD